MKYRRGIVLVLVLVFGGLVAGDATAGDEPPVILREGSITLSSSMPVFVDVSAGIRIRYAIIGSVSAKARCVGTAPAQGMCAATEGIAHLAVAASAMTPGKGLLVVSDPATGRTDSRQVVIPEPAKPGPPEKLTVPVTGCASWYRTPLFGCPEKESEASAIDGDAHLPDGKAVVSGAAGVGVVTFTGSANPTVAGLDGFGESSGKLGEDDHAIEVTVRRRAPLWFGFVVVLVGAAFAASVGWFTEWARTKSAGDIAFDLYGQKHGEFSDRRRQVLRKLRTGGLGVFAGVWGLGKQVRPANLNDAQQRDPASVTAYVREADTLLATWRDLEALLDVKHEVDGWSPSTPLGLWLKEVVSEGPSHDDYAASRSLADAVRTALSEWPPQDERVPRLLEANHPDEIRQVLLQSTPVPRREISGARPGPSAPWPGPTSLAYRMRPLSWLLPVVALVIAVAAVVVGVQSIRVTLPDFMAVGLYAAAAAAAGVAAVKARQAKKVPVLAAALLGWFLAAAFGGADALDAAKGWGSPGDIVKTIGASFAVAGTAQVLRLGFPSKSDD